MCRRLVVSDVTRRRVVENYTVLDPDLDRFSERIYTTYFLQVIGIALQIGNARMIPVLVCGDPLGPRRFLNSSEYGVFKSLVSLRTVS